MRVVVLNHVSLDGVMQAPGRAEEDIRGGFAHGGWAMPGNDAVMGQALGERMAGPGGGLLLGRRTYQDLLSFWNSQPDSPFAAALNTTPKYVASTNAGTSLDWPNSTLLHGDVPAAVAKLKDEPGGDLTIMGSRVLIQALMPHGLIDEYLLMIHPLVIGSGQRLFPDADATTRLRLLDTLTTTTGVVMATYQPA